MFWSFRLLDGLVKEHHWTFCAKCMVAMNSGAKYLGTNDRSSTCGLVCCHTLTDILTDMDMLVVCLRIVYYGSHQMTKPAISVIHRLLTAAL
eukprot:scaffold186425_cov21-Prasinocladus_malaysianus.AAC.1